MRYTIKASYELSKKYCCVKFKCYTLIELMFLKELMLIKQTNPKSVMFSLLIFFKLRV